MAAYFTWYGLGRSWLEAIRIDPTSDAPLGIPANTWASFAVVVLGIAIFVVQTVRHRGEPDSSPFTVTPQQRQDAEALSPAGS
ncbi:prolipoprotein diacylglyceryl transferase family protein [Microbacterium lacticum]